RRYLTCIFATLNEYRTLVHSATAWTTQHVFSTQRILDLRCTALLPNLYIYNFQRVPGLRCTALLPNLYIYNTQRVPDLRCTALLPNLYIYNTRLEYRTFGARRYCLTCIFTTLSEYPTLVQRDCLTCIFTTLSEYRIPSVHGSTANLYISTLGEYFGSSVHGATA
ncbi:hypothetical protein RRG08_051751, partial [Elysia crispata]